MRTNIIEKAASFAAEKHKNQYRKEGNLLYISHLVGVALILQKYNFSNGVIAAGLLHDTLEDTDTTEQEILENFGQEILDMILLVTNDDNLTWKEKKQKYIDTVAISSEEVKAIALADKIHNMESLLFNLEEAGAVGAGQVDIFWQNFNASKYDKLWFEETCLEMFKKTFSHPMVTEYESQVVELRKKYF